ncbi:MAG TPA: MerR family transcriptional regulator [Nocardioidaceae bacterium]|nr:MerR family transcriptional regulator [Nocardioidaceae bacterium]
MSTQPMTDTDLLAETLGVSEVAEEAGVAASAVRFYEQHGLVTAARTSGNQRRFTADAGCRIRVARVAQRVGLTVREIVTIMESLPPDPTPADWGKIAQTLVAEARARVDRLEATLADLGSGAKLCLLDPSDAENWQR